MSGLIVDFPHERRQRRCKFSSTSKLQVYERHDDDDTGRLFYSERDIRAMRLAHKRYVEEAHRRFLSLSRDNEDDIFVPVSFSTATKAVRDRVRCAVLEEQARQDCLGEYDPHRLAYTSEHHSRCAARNAHRVGLYHSKQ